MGPREPDAFTEGFTTRTTNGEEVMGWGIELVMGHEVSTITR